MRHETTLHCEYHEGSRIMNDFRSLTQASSMRFREFDLAMQEQAQSTARKVRSYSIHTDMSALLAEVNGAGQRKTTAVRVHP